MIDQSNGFRRSFDTHPLQIRFIDTEICQSVFQRKSSCRYEGNICMDLAKKILSKQSFNRGRGRSYDSTGQNDGNSRNIFQCKCKINAVCDDGQFREAGQLHSEGICGRTCVEKDAHVVTHQFYSLGSDGFFFRLIFQSPFIKKISSSGQIFLITGTIPVNSSAMCFGQELFFIHLVQIGAYGGCRHSKQFAQFVRCSLSVFLQVV